MHPAALRWLKDVASGKVYAAKRYRPADAPILFASLPLGTDVVPMAYWTKYGLWQGDPVRVSIETNGFTAGYQEGKSLVSSPSF